jgi:hypothetical protein
MNGNGLSETLSKEFPNLPNIERPQREFVMSNSTDGRVIYDPSWLVGFIDAVRSGCFFVNIRKASGYKTGFQIVLKFQVTQHTRDKLLLQNIVNFLNCGRYRETTNSIDGKVEVEKFKDITEKIIPFLDKYPLIGSKVKDFSAFSSISELMKKGAHLTPGVHKGLGPAEIRRIKSGMNRARS